jgi:hypothetical protein
MKTINSTNIDNESQFDSILQIKLVSYTSVDIAEARKQNLTIDQLIFQTFNSDGWNCGHSYDCCGCWASFVQDIKTIRKGVKAVTIRHIKNV